MKNFLEVNKNSQMEQDSPDLIICDFSPYFAISSVIVSFIDTDEFISRVSLLINVPNFSKSEQISSFKLSIVVKSGIRGSKSFIDSSSHFSSKNLTSFLMLSFSEGLIFDIFFSEILSHKNFLVLSSDALSATTIAKSVMS